MPGRHQPCAESGHPMRTEFSKPATMTRGTAKPDTVGPNGCDRADIA